MPLVRSVDYGEDRPSGQALLARHRDLEGQIRAYEDDIKSKAWKTEHRMAKTIRLSSRSSGEMRCAWFPKNTRKMKRTNGQSIVP